MIKAGIIGATGYAGNELARLLLGHKEVEVAWYGSRSYIDQKYADVYQNFFKLIDAKCMDDNMAALADEVDVIFTATPQGLCASLVNEEILSKAKVVDLSADFRIKDVKKMKNGMASSTKHLSLLMRQFMACARSTVRTSKKQDLLRTRDVIRHVRLYQFIRY